MNTVLEILAGVLFTVFCLAIWMVKGYEIKEKKANKKMTGEK